MSDIYETALLKHEEEQDQLYRERKEALTEKSNFLIQITHSPDTCPEAIATKVVGGQGCIKIKVLEMDTRSTKEHPYIAS